MDLSLQIIFWHFSIYEGFVWKHLKNGCLLYADKLIHFDNE